MSVVTFTPKTSGAAIARATTPVLQPVVHRLPGGRDAIRRADDLRVPAVYLATFPGPDVTQVYVGMSTCVLNRAAGEHVATADQILVISEASNSLKSADLQVLERSMHAHIDKLRGYETLNAQYPYAEAIGQRRFAAVQLFLTSALDVIQQEGWLFRNMSPRELHREPFAFDDLASFHADRAHPEGDLLEIKKSGVTARAIWMGDEKGVFVLRDSLVRREIVRSAPRILGARREELLYGGYLGVEHYGDYRVRYPLWFPTLGAAAEFVTGSSSNRKDWRLVDAPPPPPLRAI